MIEQDFEMEIHLFSVYRDGPRPERSLTMRLLHFIDPCRIFTVDLCS